MYNYGRTKKHFAEHNIAKEGFGPQFEVLSLGSTLYARMTPDDRVNYFKRATEQWYAVEEDDLKTLYGDHLLGWLDQYITIVSRVCDDDFLRLPVVDFRKKILADKNKNRSYFKPELLLKGLNLYKPNEDTLKVEPPPFAAQIIKRYFSMLDAAIKELASYTDEEQEALIIAELPPEKNIGYPTFVAQSKKVFKEQFDAYCKRHFSRTYPLTVKGLLSMIETEIDHIYILFYRTKDEDIARGIFGGNASLKAIGCLFSAIKKMTAYKLPRIGDWPLMAHEDWSIMFPTFSNTLAGIITKAEYDAIGEDIENFDGHVKPSDLDWLDSFHGTAVKFMRWVRDGMKKNKTMFGPFVIKGVFFTSGNPFTQIFGSLIHFILCMIAAIRFNCRILHGVWLSDDDLVVYDKRIPLSFLAEVFLEYGYPIKGDKSHVWSTDKVVQFLKVYIGHVFTKDEVSFIGNPASRYINMIHRERGSPEVLAVFPTTDNVNMLIHQCASYSDRGVLIVKALLDELKYTDVGKEAIRVLTGFKLGSIKYQIEREDLNIGFKPDWLVAVV